MEYNVDKFLSLIDERREELFGLLVDMIQIDSQSFGDSGTGREAEMALYLESKYKALGLETDLYSPLDAQIRDDKDYYDGRHLEKRYNCTAIYPGTNHDKRVMLAAHEDTVIIGDESKWSVDPLAGTIKNGRIYGRGACDDKYALATMLFLANLMKEQNIRLPYDLLLAGYSDEENGGSNGALALCKRYKCDDAVSLDGHCLQVISGGAGGGVVKVSIISDYPRASCEEMMVGFKIVRQEWKGFASRRKEEFLTRPYFAESEVPDDTVRYTDIHAGMNGTGMERLEALITFYTVHSEEETKAEWSEMIARINNKLLPLHMKVEEFEMCTRFFHFVETCDSEAMKLMSSIAEEFTGIKKEPMGMCLSDLPMFVLHGTPKAFGFGGGRGFSQEGGAHHADEYIETEDFLLFTKILAKFLLRYECE